MTLTQAQEAGLYTDRKGGKFRCLLWIEPTNRATDLVEGMGFWSGLHEQSFSLEGETRAYFGFGQNIDFGVLEYETGLLIGDHVVSINGAAPEVRALVRNYRYSGAVAQIHFAHYDRTTQALSGTSRKWNGYINEAPEVRAADMGSVTLSVSLVSSVRDLSETPNLMKSDAAQKNAHPTDTFRRDGTMNGATDNQWKPD